MAAVGGNNVYVDIIFRLQAEAAKRAERIISNLIKKGQFATLALKRLGIPSDFPKTTLEATTQIFRLAQGADAAKRANSALWQQAISPLLENFRQEAKTLESLSDQYLRLSTLSWEALQSQAEGRRIIQELGLTEQNYANVLSSVGQAYGDQAAEYYKFIKSLKEGQLIHQDELKRLKEAWNIYKATGIRLAELRDSSISLGKKWESLVPLSERVWKPTTEQINTLAKGLSALDETAARDMMTMARHAAVAKAFNEPIANIDENAYRLLGNLDQINFRLAKMGITLPITTGTSKALAQAQAQISDEALAQARAFAESAASLDRLGISARGNLALGSQLYDIFTGNSRMALELEDSVRAATGVLDRHARGLHLVNRALREQNANFAISQETINRITREGWGVFTEEQKKALQAIKKNYETTLEYTGVLDKHERALLRVIRRTEVMDKALHFQLRTAEDAAFLLKRLKTEGYEALTAAEKRAIDELEKNIALTWTWDSRTKALAQRIIDAKNAYKEQGMILRELTPRQRAFYGAIYRLQGGMSRLSRFIDRVSIGSLKLLGPLFLATAAFNTFSRIIGGCISSFTEYEDRLIDLRVAGEMSLSSVNRLSEAFISLERILPVSATQLAQIATLAAKAGVTGTEQIKAFTIAIAKFTKVTGWSADEASDALLKISRAFSYPIENTEKLASMMHHLAVVSVADAKDIVNAMTRVGAAATNLGISADMAAAMATTLIDAGMGAERAGTRLRAFFREFLEKSDKVLEAVDTSKEGFQDFADTLETRPGEALIKFIEYLASITDEIERSRIVYSIFGSVASFAILTLVEHYDELTKRMQEAERELTYGTRLTEDFSVWMDAASTSIAKAENSINRLQRAIGAGLAPAVTTLAGGLSSALENLFGLNTQIKITTKGTQEWIEVFEAGYPHLSAFNKELAITKEMISRPWEIVFTIPPLTPVAHIMEWIPPQVGEQAAALNKITSEWQTYTENVAAGGDIVLGYSGKVLDILDEVGLRTREINFYEEKYQQINEDINNALAIRNELERKYGKETLERIWQKIKNEEQLSETEEKLRDEATLYHRTQEFLNRATVQRTYLEKLLMDAIARRVEIAVRDGEVTGENAIILRDYLKLYNAFDKSINSVNSGTALALALMSKTGALFGDLKRNMDPKTVSEWAKRIEQASKSSEGAGDIINEINKQLESQGLYLVETADGWRLLNRSMDETVPTSDEIARAFKEIKKSAENLNKTTPEEFLDSLDEGWRSIERFMNATASAARAKIELDKTLRYTPAGIMFEAEYGEQIERINKLMEEYQNAADATVAAEKAQALMAEILALQQAVLNDIQSESSLVLQEQKLAWLDIIDTMYEWVEGITSEVPLAAKSLEEWETKYAEIAETSDTAFKQLEDAIEAVTEQIGALRPATESASEAAKNAAPSMNTFGTALGTAAWSASVMNDELGSLPENIEGAKQSAEQNPINITASSNIDDVLSELNKSIEEFVPQTISIPVTLSFLLPPFIDLAWSAAVKGLGKVLETMTGTIGLSFEFTKPKAGTRQYGGEIRRTGEYLLHRGEYVLPSRDLQRLIDALYLMTRRERAEEFSAQKIYNIRIEGEPTPGAARFIRELEYIG